jgi:hypothetical protein
MNRSWICSALVGTLALAAWGSLQAAPLVQISLEGRRAGEGVNDWRSTITDVKSGDRLEYRIRVAMSPVGTSNTQQEVTGAVTRTINVLGPQDGMNSVHLNLRQAASDSIQVDFLRGAVRQVTDPETGEVTTVDDQLAFLPTAWKGLPGFTGGDLAPRAGTPYDNLDNIRAQRGGGSFAGGTAPAVMATSASNADPNLEMVGDLMVMTDGLQGVIMPSWFTGSGNSGGGRINAGSDPNAQTQFFVGNDTQANSADPMVGFTPLTLVGIPEPSTFVLAGLGLVGLVAVARRRRS